MQIFFWTQHDYPNLQKYENALIIILVFYNMFFTVLWKKYKRKACYMNVCLRELILFLECDLFLLINIYHWLLWIYLKLLNAIYYVLKPKIIPLICKIIYCACTSFNKHLLEKNNCNQNFSVQWPVNMKTLILYIICIYFYVNPIYFITVFTFACPY